MATDPPNKNEAWLTPSENARRQGEYRRRTRGEEARDGAMRDWFGGDLAPLEIEARQSPASHIGKLVDELLGSMNAGEKVLLRRLLSEWHKIVGVEIQSHCRPRNISGKVLYIELPEPAWRYRLAPVQGDILARVRDYSDGRITDIRLVPGGRT